MKTPEFYVIGAHGSGLQSFLYYLNLIGTPSTSWWWDKDNIQLGDNDYPSQRARANYRYGITVDCVLKKKIACGDCSQKKIWLLRDPVLLIRSVINQIIGDCINPYMKLMRTNFLGRELLDTLLVENSKYYCQYSSQLGSVVANGEILAIDTTELLPGRVLATMKKVADFLEVDLPKLPGQIFQVSYNSFENRYYREASKYKCLNGRNVGLCKSQLFDFHFNFWGKSRVLETVEVTGETWVVFVNENEAIFSLSHAELQSICKNISHIQMYQKIGKSIYEQEAISVQKMLDWFMNDREYLAFFVNHVESELSMVHKYANCIFNTWSNYHALRGETK